MFDSAALMPHASGQNSAFQLRRHSSEVSQDADPFTFWLTGLSGAGKSTLATEFAHISNELALRHHVLDGDVMREGLCSDLGFSEADRAENIRRIAEAARLLNQAGVHAIVAVISPFRAHREAARRIIGVNRFVEIHIDTSLATCMERDPKGLYAKAHTGQLKNFTGLSAPYETPHAPDLVIRTEDHSIPECHGLLRRFALSLISRPVPSAILAA